MIASNSKYKQIGQKTRLIVLLADELDDMQGRLSELRRHGQDDAYVKKQDAESDSQGKNVLA